MKKNMTKKNMKENIYHNLNQIINLKKIKCQLEVEKKWEAKKIILFLLKANLVKSLNIKKTIL